jgi:hypothetical protein
MRRKAQQLARLKTLNPKHWTQEGPNNVHILQPGSTAITSLTHGESAVKHCFYLDIKRPKEGEPYKYRDRKVSQTLNHKP